MYPQLTTLPYQQDAALRYFASFANKPWSMLLHSGYSGHSSSRYDIFVALPEVTLITYNGVTRICSGNECKWSKDDPFLLVQKQLEKMHGIVPVNNELPFQGGALGFFSYDLIRSIEILPALAKNDLSLPEMAIGIYKWAVIVDHFRRLVTLVSYDKRITSSLLTQLTAEIFLSPMPFNILDNWKLNMSRSEYSDKFFQVQRHLLAGDCYQVCLSQRFSAPYSGDEWTAFLHLLTYNQAPFSAFIRLKEHIVISFSPERFLHVQHGKIQTCPIKGTLPRLKDIDEDHQQVFHLVNSAKDQAENLMIVDLLRNDIGRVAKPGSVHVPSLFKIETYATVHHMVSTISAVLPKNRTPCDLLRACFPGGSITGVPKIEAMKTIERLEPQRRSVWSGSIGYISYCGTMDTNIAIRTLLVLDQHVYCSVGSGLVADSNEKKEYQEILAKAASLLPLLKRLNHV
ncbi:aminodeoxychorismate synthase component I [Sodalis sp. CWE]|uniref:aminodeoxychorismate synthase component I n=1 Tax=Sodalis sp. CWE TaxID=2803816 RepID=UPI001C7D1218|nr:aminodeoxychorismate synthase component I [Sodalis sp. CWE]MBX4181181.1 aminodeoxychorismate synthase component I [Sodalis sp. CWE]